jgi:predicted glycosyltransferase
VLRHVTRSLLFYVQHLLGIGHLRRALRLVESLVQERFRVTLVSGGEPLPALAATTADLVQLPPIHIRGSDFRDLVDAGGRPVDDALRAARRARMLDAFDRVRPNAVMIEAFPFGRRAFRFELDPLIAAARSCRPRSLVACSVRDIVVAPEAASRRHEIVARVRADFDVVLVHGDPAFIPLEASFPATAEIADRLVYTGYVAAGETVGSDMELGGARPPEVLVSAGGGAVGGALMATALEARRRGCLAEFGWRFLAGPNLPPATFAALAARLPVGVALERYRTDFPDLLRRCHVSISQAGYNTVLDILAARAAAVVVPFAAGRETEQRLRAERLAARGVLQMVPEDELTPDRLAEAIRRAVASHPAGLAVDMAGAERTARLLQMLLDNGGRAGLHNFAMLPSEDMIGG